MRQCYHDIKKIDELIRNYKISLSEREQRELLSDILASFEGFIVKYANFLKNGEYNASDRDLLGLIKMLKSPKNTIDQTIGIIRKTLDGYTYDDIIGELKLRFVKCIKRYTKKEDGPPFTGFVYAYYKFIVKEWIASLSKDLLNSKTIVTLDKVMFFACDEFSEQLKIFDDLNMLDNTELTNLEKYILYLYYEKAMRDREISKTIGLTRAYVNKIKNNAISKIKKSGLNEHDLVNS